MKVEKLKAEIAEFEKHSKGYSSKDVKQFVKDVKEFVAELEEDIDEDEECDEDITEVIEDFDFEAVLAIIKSQNITEECKTCSLKADCESDTETTVEALTDEAYEILYAAKYKIVDSCEEKDVITDIEIDSKHFKCMAKLIIEDREDKTTDVFLKLRLFYIPVQSNAVTEL